MPVRAGVVHGPSIAAAEAAPESAAILAVFQPRAGPLMRNRGIRRNGEIGVLEAGIFLEGLLRPEHPPRPQGAKQSNQATGAEAHGVPETSSRIPCGRKALRQRYLMRYSAV